MAIDYAVKIINGEDTSYTAFASTAATAVARDVTAVSSTSGELATFVTAACAYAVVPKTVTATQLKRLAWTALLEAGVTIDGGDGSLDTPAELAVANTVANVKLKGVGGVDRQFAKDVLGSLV